MMRKTRDQWLGQLVDELKMQAQKSFQVGSFEKISNPAVNEKAPELMETLNNLLNCANLLLNHARENMTMLNRINHSGMWSMYFGNDSQVNRVAFSDEFREITGYTDRNEFSDSVDAWTAKIYEGDRKRVIQEFQDTIKDSTQQKKFDTEYRFETKHNGLRWMRMAGEIVWRGKKPFEFIGIITDITTAHNNARELDVSTKRHDAIDSILNEGSWSMNVVNGDITNPENPFWYSEQFRKLLGYHNEQDFPNSPNSYSNLIHEEERKNIMEQILHYVKSGVQGAPLNLEFRIRHIDGSYRWFHMTVTAVFDSSHNPIVLAAATLDITEQKRSREIFEADMEESIHSLAAGLDKISTVVADEVGSLAVSCNETSKHISESLNEMRQSIEQIISKIEGMDNAVQSQSGNMEKINTMTNELNDLCERVKEIARTVFA